jgi:putative ABC transport system ATP-binding protein
MSWQLFSPCGDLRVEGGDRKPCVIGGKMIELDGVSKIYRMGDIELRALNNVSLKIDSGDLVAMMGPSGSGKSTMMNILGCLDVPTDGAYRLDGNDVGGLSDNALAEIRNRKIGFVFQSFNLIPRTSAVRNVELPMVYAGMGGRRDKAVEALERVGLGGRVKHMPNELSGGQQQRVAIARAIVTDPVMILADEPTGNLDSTSTVEIMKLLIELNDSGRTVILITHEDEVASFAKRVITLRDGEIVRDEIPRSRAAITP